GRELGDAEPLPQALIVAEEEESVALDGTAGGGAELVADKQGNRLVRVIEEVLGIECRIAQKFVYVPVQRVGTRFADRVDDAAHGAAEFGAGVVGNDLELADTLHPGKLSTGSASREVLRVIDVGAVQHENVGGQARARDRELRAAPLVGTTARRSRHVDAGL